MAAYDFEGSETGPFLDPVRVYSGDLLGPLTLGHLHEQQQAQQDEQAAEDKTNRTYEGFEGDN